MPTRRFLTSFCLLFAVSLLARADGVPEGRLMRFPDIHNDKIVFSYAGDLWLASSSGGTAHRITTNLGLELFPKFSPDGKWIAFTAQYDGNFNVYVIPSEGGQPKQLTFLPDIGEVPERMGPNNEVITWYPDSKRILFLSRRNTFNSWFGRLFSIGIDGGLPEQLPLEKGGLTSFSPDGSKVAYNRIFRNFRTWKRYTGGMAQDVWTYDFQAKHAERITDYPGTDTFPMWHGDSIYFTSDRGPEHRLNLYQYDFKDRKTHQLTSFKDYDIGWPSLGPDSIIFDNGGYLYVFDLKTEKAKKLTVYLPGDNDAVRKHWASTSKLVSGFDIAPEGKSVVFTARGDVYTSPVKDVKFHDITDSSGSRERFAAWSPDGKWIAYVSDGAGEDELYIAPPDGSAKPTQITTGGTAFLSRPAWSPDSKKLLYSDSNVRLFYVDIDGKQPVQIDTDQYNDITDYGWSPDSQWVTYAKTAENTNSVVYLYSLANSKITPVTDSFTTSWQPVFDPGGKYLYFLSNRDYNEVLGAYDAEFSNPKATRPYMVTLRADLKSPFEVSEEEAASKTEPKDKNDEPFRIDLDSIADRVVAVPVPPGNYGDLGAAKGTLFYVSSPTSGLSGPLPGQTPSIQIYDIAKKTGKTLVDQATGYALSFDGTKLLYSAPAKPGEGGGLESFGPTERTYGVVDAKLPEDGAHKSGDGALNLSTMRFEVDPHQEWDQIFNEAWRQERDYFFEKSMNGVDWDAMRQRYSALLPYVADRYDLTGIIGDMIGELSNSHTYVGGGDSPELKPVNVGLLGVDFETDTAHNLYRFKKIYHGQNWDEGLRSPLTEPGIGVKEGDYLLAVNGHDLRVPQNPYELFENTAGERTTLTVNSQPTPDGAREVVVKPIGNEFGLRELDWIETNRQKVDKLSGGRVGYVYIPDMGAHGLNEFVKQFFPQIRKEGLVIDVRYNGGGFVDQLIFERLRRVLAGMQAARHWKSNTIPDDVFHGYMACVTNHYAASDGDFFSHFFKEYKLGPLVGERTWGGVRGIRGYISLVDGGYVTRPEFSLYGLKDNWLIENHGVDPDVVVDNTPDEVMRGHDPQLEKAVELVMKQIEAHPAVLPARPSDLPAYPSN